MKIPKLISLIYLYLGLAASVVVITFGAIKLSTTAVKLAIGSYKQVTYPTFPYLSGQPVPSPEEQAKYDSQVQELDKLTAEKTMIEDTGKNLSIFLAGIILFLIFRRLVNRAEASH